MLQVDDLQNVLSAMNIPSQQQEAGGKGGEGGKDAKPAALVSLSDVLTPESLSAELTPEECAEVV